MATNIISTPALTEYFDAITLMFIAARGSDPTDDQAPENPNGYGFGVDNEWGVGSYVPDLVEAVRSAADAGVTGIDAIVALGNEVQSLQSKMNIRTVANNYFASTLAMIQAHIASSTAYQTVDRYMTFLNCEDATPWQLLLPQAFNDLHNFIYGAYMQPNNVWREVLQGIPASNPNVRVYENALGKLVAAGAFTAGIEIDSDVSCGGFPKLKIASIVGNGDVTVTGNAFDPDTKTVFEDVTWIASNVSSPITYTLVPSGGSAAPDNSLILKVTDMDSTQPISAMTAYVEAHRPTSRAIFNY